MYATCLYCRSHLGGNDVVESFPVGRRLAFDAGRGRLWVVCGGCGRWNLSPIDERWEAIETCERLFRDTRARVTTDQIGLARLSEGLELVRIGAPLRPEFAAWRYGNRFRRRRTQTHMLVAGAVVAGGAGVLAFGPLLAPAVTMGAVSLVVGPGLTSVMGTIPAVGVLAMKEYLENDRIVGRVVHDGRVLIVRARHVRSTQLEVLGDDAATVTLRLQHDGGWADIHGLHAMQTAGVLLAGANRYGGSGSDVRDAVRRLEHAGDAATYLRAISTIGGARSGRMNSIINLWRDLGALRLSGRERLALEMSLHEESERRALEGELALLESAWRDAEQLARIADAL